MTEVAPALVVLRGAEFADGGDAVATCPEPWLAMEWPGLRALAGSFVTIAYRASIWDAPTRPLLRFLSGAAVLSEVIAPAPLEAAASWTGRMPRGTTEVHVSPADRPGRFGFRIESIRRRRWPALLVEGHRRARRPARSAALTKLIGWGPESDHNLAWAIGAHPFEDFATWSAERRRPLELDRLDRPRVVWDRSPSIRVVVLAAGAEAIALERTLDSLRRQLFPGWEALVIGAPAVRPGEETRIIHCASASAASSVLSDGSWVAVVPAGLALRPEALAIVAERRAREPEARMVYGDEIAGGRPILKPGWSPRLAAALPYLGRAVFAAPSVVTLDALDALLRGEPWRVPTGVTPLALRRILADGPDPAARRRPQAGSAPRPRPRARAAIIVLTRDQPALVARLAASIRAKTASGGFRLVFVDNGAADGPAAAVLADLAADAAVEVLPRPGPFNFSAMCNQAAASSDEEVLVFLNDDMEVLSDGWLDRLVLHALEPDVGAVGARLTYPDGRLQHVGVLAGMGGSAGHFGAPAPGDDPGWAGRNDVLHEVSAVTGACLAVERVKFEAVGGFDAERLPIELSDIDLCFKLNARGWQTLVDPAVHLLHEESFSRGGATFRRLDKYGAQRAVFVERWRHVLRDDPVFHPALSLYSWRAALG